MAGTPRDATGGRRGGGYQREGESPSSDYDHSSSPESAHSDEGRTTVVHSMPSRERSSSSSSSAKKRTNVVVSASKRKSKITVGGKDYMVSQVNSFVCLFVCLFFCPSYMPCSDSPG